MPESHDLQVYLESTDVIDWSTPEIRLLVDALVAVATSDVEKAQRLYRETADTLLLIGAGPRLPRARLPETTGAHVLRRT